MGEVKRWLEGLCLASYAPVFGEQHIEFDRRGPPRPSIGQLTFGGCASK